MKTLFLFCVIWYNQNMAKSYDVVIIGGGMSGIILAITLKKAGISTCIVEAKDRIGKKILASGNGKCNILNTNLDISNYNNSFPAFALEKYNYNELSKFYNSLGLLLKADDEGRVYPYSESSNTVLNIFLEEINKLNIPVFENEKVTSISEINDKFSIKSSNSEYISRVLVLASGSNATTGYNSHVLLAPFSHHITKTSQSLVPIKAEALKGANGVRSKAYASLYINNNKVFGERGELLFKDNAISGILAFKMSAHIAREIVKGKSFDSYIEIDFVPDYSEEELNLILENTNITGILHKAIANNFKESKNIAHDIKHYKCKVLGLMGLDNAQVTSGGLDTKEFDNTTMQSKIVKNLYAIGEVLDVDGQCGGYNLAFAAASALICRDSIIKDLC